MSKLLYCNDEYIQTFDRFVQIVNRAISDGNKNDALRQEILALFRDGEILDWLEDIGHQSFKSFAEIRVNGSTDSDLISEIARRCNLSAQQFSLPFDEYVELLDRITVICDGKSQTQSLHVEISLSEEKNRQITFNFKVLKPANEKIPVRLKIVRAILNREIDCPLIGASLTASIPLQHKGKIITLTFDISNIQPGDKLILLPTETEIGIRKSVNLSDIGRRIGATAGAIITSSLSPSRHGSGRPMGRLARWLTGLDSCMDLQHPPLIIENGDVFDVYNSAMNPLEKGLRLIKKGKTFMIGYSSEKNAFYFVSSKQFFPFNSNDCQYSRTLEVKTCNVGEHEAFRLSDGTNTCEYVVIDSKPKSLEYFMTEYCAKYDLPYAPNPFTLKLYSMPDYREVTIPCSRYSYIAYIGKDDEGPLFLARESDLSKKHKIVRLNGLVECKLDLYPKIIAIPIIGKGLFAYYNPSSKTLHFYTASSKSEEHKSYHWENCILSENPYLNSPGGLMLSEKLRYLINEKDCPLFRISRVNRYFYINKGSWDFNNNKNDLYLSSDQHLFEIRGSKNLGCGYIVVVKYDNFAHQTVVLSPTGSIIYTLKPGETIESYDNGERRSPMRYSEGGFIVRSGDTYKVISYDGIEIGSFKGSKVAGARILGYHAGYAFYLSGNRITYFDLNGNEYQVGLSSLGSIQKIEILPSGNILVKSNPNGYQTQFIVFNLRGEVLKLSTNKMYVLD